MTDFQTVLSRLPAAVSPDAVAGVDRIIQFNAAEPSFLRIADGACSVHAGTAPTSDVALTMSDADFVELLQGRLNGVNAFMSGRLKVTGDLMLAQGLLRYFDPAKLS